MSLHIAAKKGQIAESILLPGDPLRAEFIAENFLRGAEKYTDIRNMYGFTGTYKGVPVSVQGTGMGMPSMGIYSWELITEYGVQNLIRIGTAGAFTDELALGDIFVALAASTDSNYQHAFDLPGQYSPEISFVRVDLPQPELPTNATRLPGLSVMLKSRISGSTSRAVRVLRTVVHTLDQGIFKSYPSCGLLNIIPTGRKQRFHRISLVDRHDFVTHLVADRVQRNGKIDLRKVLREPRDHRRQPAG